MVSISIALTTLICNAAKKNKGSLSSGSNMEVHLLIKKSLEIEEATGLSHRSQAPL